MVNADRVKRKLPSLLVDGSTTKKKNWNSLMRNRYLVDRFKKQNPERYNALLNKTVENLNDWKEAIKI